MKKFIKNTLLFLAIPILVFIVLDIIATYYLAKSSYYRIDSKITDLYIGDSHIQKSIADSLLQNSQNIATSSESLYFSYYRLKNSLESDNNIETVYLGLGYHSLSNYYDAFIFGKHSGSISPKYYFLLPYKEQIKFFYANKSSLNTYFKSIVDQSQMLLSDTMKLGGYENPFKVSKSTKNFMDKRIASQFFTDSIENDFSSFNLEYLEKIIQLCKKSNVNLTIVNTPLDSYYFSQIPIKFVKKYNMIIEKNHLELIDFGALELSESCFIPDGDHVSEIGAVKMIPLLINSNVVIKNK